MNPSSFEFRLGWTLAQLPKSERDPEKLKALFGKGYDFVGEIQGRLL